MRLAILAILLASCDSTPMDAAADSGSDLGCTEWGRVSRCQDGTPGCDQMICMSHDPQPCRVNGFPCADGGGK
jgi:hypothetical protein